MRSTNSSKKIHRSSGDREGGCREILNIAGLSGSSYPAAGSVDVETETEQDLEKKRLKCKPQEHEFVDTTDMLQEEKQFLESHVTSASW